MKAYELQPQEGFDALTLVDRSSPEVLPGHVRVRVRAVSLNYRDLGVVRGAKRRRSAIVPVSDGAGEVVALGDGVTSWKIGDRVMGAFFPTWNDGPLSDYHHARALGGGQDGMLAEEVVLPERAWIPVPEHLSLEEAATLPCAGLTAYHALFEAAHVHPGDTVLLQGTGGVSIFALQLARAAGAQVIITSSSEEKRERARTLGAAHTLDYRTDSRWGDSARTWTGGRGVDAAIDVGGPGTFDQTVAALRDGGTMSILGVLTGTKGEINTYGIFHKALRVVGVYVGSIAMFQAFARSVTTTGLRPVVDRVFPFDEVRAAYEHLAAGRHFGKVVVRL